MMRRLLVVRVEWTTSRRKLTVCFTSDAELRESRSEKDMTLCGRTYAMACACSPEIPASRFVAVLTLALGVGANTALLVLSMRCC